MSSNKSTLSDKAQRKGLVVGLTVAEIMFLLIFALLLIFSVTLINMQSRTIPAEFLKEIENLNNLDIKDIDKKIFRFNENRSFENEKFQNMTADNIISILENLKIYETEFINEIEDINELDFSKDSTKKNFRII